MQTIPTTCLNVKFNVVGAPTSFSELLEIGAKAGLTEQQLLDKVVGFFVAHNVNEDGRDVIRDLGPEALGVPFKTKTVKDAAGKETEIDDETVGVWAKRAAADKGTDGAGLAALLQPIIDNAMATDDAGKPVEVDGNPVLLKDLEFSVGGVRKGGKGGGNKLGKEVLAQATAAITAGQGETVVGMLTTRHPDLTFARYETDTTVKNAAGADVVIPTGTVTIESLAAAIRTNKLRREQEDAKMLGLVA